MKKRHIRLIDDPVLTSGTAGLLNQVDAVILDLRMLAYREIKGKDGQAALSYCLDRFLAEKAGPPVVYGEKGNGYYFLIYPIKKNSSPFHCQNLSNNSTHTNSEATQIY